MMRTAASYLLLFLVGSSSVFYLPGVASLFSPKIGIRASRRPGLRSSRDDGPPLPPSSSSSAFYLPGIAPRDFQKGDEIQVKVNKLSSAKTQLLYDYYFLDYCKPLKIVNNAKNLGEALRGNRSENSVYTHEAHQGNREEFQGEDRLRVLSKHDLA